MPSTEVPEVPLPSSQVGLGKGSSEYPDSPLPPSRTLAKWPLPRFYNLAQGEELGLGG